MSEEGAVSMSPPSGMPRDKRVSSGAMSKESHGLTENCRSPEKNKATGLASPAVHVWFPGRAMLAKNLQEGQGCMAP